MIPHKQTKVAVGVDLGQSKDPTSIAVVERESWHVPDHLAEHWRRKYPEQLKLAQAELPATRFNLRVLEQAPLGESYPAQAYRVKRILARPSIVVWSPRVFVDYTGVGRAVFDIFKQERVPHIVPVTIAFAGTGPNSGGGLTVAKIDLVSPLQALMHTGQLHMPESLPLSKVFRRELLDFRVSYSDVGNARFGAREGAHDDLILAVALAVHGLRQAETTVEPLRV